MQLLDKNPATRLTWKAMCEHPFWQTPLSQRPMPPEPMLDAFIKRHGLRPAAQPAVTEEEGHLCAEVRAAQVWQHQAHGDRSWRLLLSRLAHVRTDSIVQTVLPGW